jgi:hypothetical protein
VSRRAAAAAAAGRAAASVYTPDAEARAMLTPGEPLTYLDRALAYVAPLWALRRARARRTLYLEQQRDLRDVRWVDGAPYTPAGADWVRVPTASDGSRASPPSRWRASAFWQQSPR